MAPCTVALALSRDAGNVTPPINVVNVVLLRPKHAAKRLAHYVCFIRTDPRWDYGCIEGVSVLLPPLDKIVKRLCVKAVALGNQRLLVRKSQASQARALSRD